MDNFEIIELKQGSVTTNFEEVKEELNKQLGIYRNIEVTEDSLPVCKDVKKILRGQSKNIDTFRKAVKNELSAPIKEFEEKCKELQGLIEDVITPIDEGIREFDEKTRKEKIDRAKELIKEIAAKMNFSETEAIVIKESWGNVSTSKRSIKDDITEQIQHLQEARRDRERRIETFKTLIDIENRNLDCKINIDEFLPLIDEGKDDADIITEIKAKAELIFNIEKGQKDRMEESEAVNDPPRNEIKEPPRSGYLIRVLDDRATATDVLSILADNGYFARVEE